MLTNVQMNAIRGMTSLVATCGLDFTGTVSIMNQKPTLCCTHVSSVARCEVEHVGLLDDNMSPDDLNKDPAGCILHIIIVPSVPLEA